VILRRLHKSRLSPASLGDVASVLALLERPPVTAEAATPDRSGGRRDAELLRRYARTRDPRLREQLVHRYLPLARYAAARYRRGSEPFDDLVQVASLGLLKAIDRYDPAHGAAFSSYALPTMSGELRRHFRDRGWTVRPPRDLQEAALAVEKAIDVLSRALGRSPTVGEIAERLELSEEAVLEAREALTARMSTSLSTPARGGEEDDERSLQARLGTDDDGFAEAERRATLDVLRRSLTAREREIVRLRFEEDLTQAEIGARVGLSQMHVSRLLRTAIEKLRRAALADAGADARALSA
jgi:RNA polymerase sigma-B factor